MAVSKELLEILVCPQCKTPVKITADGKGLKCSTCRRVYPDSRRYSCNAARRSENRSPIVPRGGLPRFYGWKLMDWSLNSTQRSTFWTLFCLMTSSFAGNWSNGLTNTITTTPEAVWFPRLTICAPSMW